jgi:hypothetical protein
MAPIPGSVRVTGFIAPSDSGDLYAAQDEFYNRGGWRTVADITARNAITADRRKIGMIVRVLNAGGGIEKFFTLVGGIADINWVEQNFGGGIAQLRVITVSPYGDADYTTIAAALAYAVTLVPSASNPILVQVWPGIYSEVNPLVVPNYVTVAGEAYGRGLVEVTPVTNTAAVFSLAAANAGLQKLKVKGASGSGGIGISIAGSVDVIDCIVQDCETGILVSGAGVYPTITDTTVLAGLLGSVTDAVLVQSGALVTLFNLRLMSTVGVAITRGVVADNCEVSVVGGFFRACGTGLVVKNGGEMRATGTFLSVCTTAVEVDPAGSSGSSTLYLFGNVIDGSVNYDIKTSAATSALFAQGLSADIAKCSLNNAARNVISFISDELGWERQFVLAGLSVGDAVLGRSSYQGQGGGYVRDMLVYTYNQATGIYTDVSAVARSGSGTFTFPGAAVNNAIYISVDRQDASDYLKFYGLRAMLQTLRQGGALVFEYWNGAAWTAVDIMERQYSPPNDSYANGSYLNNLQVVTRFASGMFSAWAKNDPPTTGNNRFWLRIRVSTLLTVVPVFTQFQLYPSCQKVAEDGFGQYFGVARPIRRLPFEWQSFSTSGNAPASQDVYLSDNLDVGRTFNRFADGAIDRVAMAVYLPTDIDTSCPVRLVLSFAPNGAVNGNVEWRFRWASSKSGDAIYASAAAAPPTAPDEQTVTLVVPILAAQVFTQVDCAIDIPIPRLTSKLPGSVAGRLLWLSIERNATAGNPADTYANDIIMAQLGLYYTAWSSGEHV